MAENYSVYKHTFPNGKVYIGITKQKPEIRWSGGKGYYSQIRMKRAIEKYGWDNIKHEVLFTGLTKNEAQEIEIELISKYDSANPKKGYNIDLGGNLRAPLSQEAKEKLRASNLGKTIPKEVRMKISRSTKGVKAYWYGRKHTEGTKALISEHRKGKGGDIPFTPERRERISRAQMGNQNAPQKTTRCVETGIVYRSTREAARQTGLRPSQISQCCRGERHTHGGFHWEYVEVTNNGS